MNNAKHVRKLIARINEVIRRQLISILEHYEFKNLLSNWSCLYYLSKITDNNVKIKIINLKLEEISNLIGGDDELGSLISQKVFNELDLPGNDPLSILIGSYNFDVSKESSVKILGHFAELGSNAFVPFITSITSKVFGVEKFSQLSQINLNNISKSNAFKHLVKLAKTDEANFLGLVIPDAFFPSLLAYSNNSFNRYILGVDSKKYTMILGNGAYMFVALTINSFIDTGWFLDITGEPTINLLNYSKGEIINNPNTFFTNEFEKIPYIFFKYTAECFISEHKEKELVDLGFIPLCEVLNRNFALFYSTTSLKNLDISIDRDTTKYKIPAALSYMLCACRFAHYIKIIGREKLGSYYNVSKFQDYLNNWLLQYISSDIETPLPLKYKYPLLDAKVTVMEDNFLQDKYICYISLKPHLTSAQLSANLVLKTQLTNS